MGVLHVVVTGGVASSYALTVKINVSAMYTGCGSSDSIRHWDFLAKAENSFTPPFSCTLSHSMEMPLLYIVS